MTLQRCERGECQEYLGPVVWQCEKKTMFGEILMKRTLCCAECAAVFFGGSEPEGFTVGNEE